MADGNTEAGAGYVCARCHTSKTEREMSVRAGRVLSTCRACLSAALCGGKRREAVPGHETPAEPIEHRISVWPDVHLKPTYGFDARVVDGQLQIEQDNADGTISQVLLSRLEFQHLAKLFAAWARGG